MRFAKKLKNLMDELNITQSKLSKLTGIGKSSISQYLSGKNEPSKARKFEIARALGVEEDYFEMFIPIAKIQSQMKDWSYYVSSVKFTEFTGIEIPYNNTESDNR